MAAEVFSTSDDASSIALLRRFRAGAAAVDFVHRVDVCSAAPEDLVANLEPAPDTDIGCWYFYCPKKFKNAQGKASGHRQRAIGGGGDTCWHAEGRPKEVGGGGGTACNLSYGRKDGRSFSRLGWCMMEYDDQDQSQTDAAGYVLCKVYRSPRARVKPSSSGKSASFGSKRKAAVGEHPEAPPAKLPHDQDAFFRHGPLPSVVAQVNNVKEWIGCHGMTLEQQSSKKGTEFDAVFAVDEAEATVEDLLGQETTTAWSGMSPIPPLSDADLFDGLESFFGKEQSMQFVHTPRATATACQRQQSQWMMPTSLLQGPRFELPCLMC
ncbi:unnamed protein product [Urochloa decumbens]|uniref:NAC domain-containing protein n=1 Tax=Urochloa decumbens TaxID=240449 RepID=A0ABC8Y5K9_9POAL